MSCRCFCTLYKNAKEGAGSAYQKAKTVKEGAGLSCGTRLRRIMDSVENGIMVSCATDLICGVKVGDMPVGVLADAFEIVENNFIRSIIHLILSMRSTQEEDTDAFIIFFEATEMDDTKFVLEFLIAYTDLIWEKIDTEHTILHIVAMHYHQIDPYSNEKTPLQVIIGGECEHPKREDTDLNSSHFNHNKAIAGCARVYEKVSERVRKSGTFTSYRDNVI
ncbi:hypothetical protein Tco_1378077 [Tanacetum coccineum]